MTQLVETRPYIYPSLADRRWRMLIDGEWVEADAAVAAARRSFQDGSWHRLGADLRSKILWRIADLIEERADELALVEGRNQGAARLRCGRSAQSRRCA